MRTFKTDPGDVILLILSAIVALACNLVAFGQPVVPQAPPIAVPQGPPVVKPDLSLLPPIAKPYTKAVFDSTKGPIIIFIGMRPRKIEGAVICVESEMLRGDKVVKRGIMVTVDRVTADWYVAEATDAELRDALRLRQQRPFSLRPFVGQESVPVDAPPRAADDDDVPTVRGLTILQSMTRYSSAKYTQEIATTNNRPRISPVHRSRLEAKWQVPGGMEGVVGWRSNLYRYVPEGGSVWTGSIQVLNGLGYFQPELGWKRTYPDGTVFADVLSYEGKVFEARIREKNEGRWESYVAYKNADARPEGYHGLRRSCASCHDQAGTGGYATGLVPGGDGVLSDPFEALER